MAIEDDDERARERLRDLGLLHLADQPEALKRELDKMLADRDREVAAYEAERNQSKAPGPPPRITTRTVSQPKAEKPGPKPSLLLIVQAKPGPCGKCRHANQGTADFAEGHVYCARAPEPKSKERACDVTIQAPKTIPVGPQESWDRYYFFELYDGRNGTWGVSADYRVLADDADNKLQAFQKAHLRSI